MMKRLLFLILALSLALSLFVPIGAYSDPGLNNFKDINSYVPGQFSDIVESSWSTPNIATAYEKGLMQGNADGTFAPGGSISVAETIAIAARLHHIYHGGDGIFKQGRPWYQVYIDYALKNGITWNKRFESYQIPATRAQFVSILVKSLPASALPTINNIPADAIPDLTEDADCYNAVYTLYRAGILTGYDAAGNFKPANSISRAEVATIITRMADPSLRKSFTLSAPGINDDLTFRLASDGSGYLVSACKQDVKTVTIPVSYNGLPVIGIAPGTFKDCQSLNSITVSGPSKYLYAEDGVVFSNLPEKMLLCFPPAYNIASYYYVPDGVKAIADRAFAGMNSLVSLTIPEGVTTMGDYAFEEVNCYADIFVPDSLTVIGKQLLLNQKCSVPFYVNSWGTVFAQYCDANALTHGVVMPETPQTTTIPTSVPTHQTENLTPASGRVVHTGNLNFLRNTYCYDLAAAEQQTDNEIFLEVGSHWDGVCDTTGVYGAGHTKTAAIIRAYDKSGKLIGMQQVNGDFAFCFPGAYSFGIEGGTDTGITFVPLQPIYVTGCGAYAIDPDNCYRTADGNITNYLILMYPRASMHSEFPYHLNYVSYSPCDTANPYIQENFEHYMLFEFFTRDASRVDNMRAWAFHFGGLQISINNDEYQCCISSNIPCADDFGPKSYDLFKSLKAHMLGTYYPTTQPINKISVIVDGSYPMAINSTLYLDAFAAENFDHYTLVHETVHAIDQSIAETQIAPDCWMEGRAEYITYKLLDKMGISYYNQHKNFSWDYLTQAQKDDFFSYFYFNLDRQTPYPVGYHFIKYISETYGEDVSAKIMDNLANSDYTGWHKDEAGAAIFKKCVEDATEQGVFQNFVRDVIEN